MKKMKLFVNGFLAATAILLFSQCNNGQNAQNVATTSNAAAGTTNMKIAYIEMDSLLSKYNLYNDLNESMMKKEENIRANLNQKQKELQNDYGEVQRKYQNGAYTSQERVQQEQMRLQKKAQDLDALSNKLSEELASENQKNMILLRDSINAYLKVYNKTHNYSMIISNAGFDNLLYADTTYNITKEIVAGLNKRYVRPAASTETDTKKK